MTNIQSIFNNININLFVVRRDIEDAKTKFNNLESSQDDALVTLSSLEEAIEKALSSLKECQTQLSSQQLQQYST